MIFKQNTNLMRINQCKWKSIVIFEDSTITDIGNIVQDLIRSIFIDNLNEVLQC